MSEFDVGRSKRARDAFSLDDIAVVPSRRTRDVEDVNLSWQIDAYQFEHPIISAPMDSIASPESVVTISKLGGLAILDLEGLWSRFEDTANAYEQIRSKRHDNAVLQKLYSAPIQENLIIQRIEFLKHAGVTVAVALSPERTLQFHALLSRTGVDIFVIRGTTLSAEHVSSKGETLNLKELIYTIDAPVIAGGVASYKAALHLMRAGAAGVLVGFGGGASHTSTDVLGLRVPMATAISDVAAARREYLDESGGRYVHVIADGSMGKSGDMVKALACGADALMVGSPLARATDAPGLGFHWGREATHSTLPRGQVVEFGTVGTLAEILRGPSRVADGTMNLVGAIAKSISLCGYTDLKEFQRVEIIAS